MNDPQQFSADIAEAKVSENGRDHHIAPTLGEPDQPLAENHPIGLQETGYPEPLEPDASEIAPADSQPVSIVAPPTQAPQGQFLSTVREIVETVVLALLIFLAVRSVVQNFRVEGSSMYSSFVDGQYVLVNKAIYGRLDLEGIAKWVPLVHPGNDSGSYVFHPPQRGDVIVFHPPPPNDPKRDFIKRVIGVPGDIVEVRQGRIFVNGAALNEPYISQPSQPLNPCFSRVMLAKDQFFVMGDNRGNSSDSRQWGPVSAGAIVGRTWLVYWPARDWKVAPNHSEQVPPGTQNPAPAQNQTGTGSSSGRLFGCGNAVG